MLSLLNFQACRRRIENGYVRQRRSALSHNTVEYELDVQTGVNNSFNMVFTHLEHAIQRILDHSLEIYGYVNNKKFVNNILDLPVDGLSHVSFTHTRANEMKCNESPRL